MDFDNKTVVVTGAGGGVGRQLVLQLLEAGAYVAGVDINRDALNETVAAAGSSRSRMSVYAVDITDLQQVQQLAADVFECYGSVNGLINNAGIIQPFITFAELDNSLSESLFNINFYGMMNMVRSFLPSLAKADEAFIANVSSMGGFLPVPGQSVYGASKAAVKIATESLRMELSRTNIRVSLVLPGAIETDIKKNSGLEEVDPTAEQKQKAGVKLTQPEQAARIMLNGIRKGKPKILIGSDSKAMDFLYRIMPVNAGKLIAKVMSGNHGSIFDTAESLTAAG